MEWDPAEWDPAEWDPAEWREIVALVQRQEWVDSDPPQVWVGKQVLWAERVKSLILQT